MPNWLATLLPVLSALLGVLVANRGSAQRDMISRLWEQRVKVYIEIMDWTLTVAHELKLEDASNAEKLAPEVYRRLRMPDELVVRLMAFASDSVRRSYETCNAAIFMLGSETPPKIEFRTVTTADMLRMLEQGLGSLVTAMRGELSTGSLRLPFHLRRRLQRYSASIDLDSALGDRIGPSTDLRTALTGSSGNEYRAQRVEPGLLATNRGAVRWLELV